MARVTKTDANRAVARMNGHELKKANKRHPEKAKFMVLAHVDGIRTGLRQKKKIECTDHIAKNFGYEIYEGRHGNNKSLRLEQSAGSTTGA